MTSTTSENGNRVYVGKGQFTNIIAPFFRELVENMQDRYRRFVEWRDNAPGLPPHSILNSEEETDQPTKMNGTHIDLLPDLLAAQGTRVEKDTGLKGIDAEIHAKYGHLQQLLFQEQGLPNKIEDGVEAIKVTLPENYTPGKMAALTQLATAIDTLYSENPERAVWHLNDAINALDRLPERKLFEDHFEFRTALENIRNAAAQEPVWDRDMGLTYQGNGIEFLFDTGAQEEKPGTARAHLIVKNQKYESFAAQLNGIADQLFEETKPIHAGDRSQTTVRMVEFIPGMSNDSAAEQHGSETRIFANMLEAYGRRNDQVAAQQEFFTKVDMDRYGALIPEAYVHLTAIDAVVNPQGLYNQGSQIGAIAQELTPMRALKLLAENETISEAQEVAGYYAAVSQMILASRDEPGIANPNTELFNYLLKEEAIVNVAHESLAKPRYSIDVDKMREATQELHQQVQWSGGRSEELSRKLSQPDVVDNISNYFARRLPGRDSTIQYDFQAPQSLN